MKHIGGTEPNTLVVANVGQMLGGRSIPHSQIFVSLKHVEHNPEPATA
jgi:hypothetical protein